MYVYITQNQDSYKYLLKSNGHIVNRYNVECNQVVKWN